MRVHVRIEGRVQGVGYRYATQDQAERLSVTGWVRNCADGAVEAEFAGDRDSLDAMITWCEQGPALARVARVEADWFEDNIQHSSFTVRA